MKSDWNHQLCTYIITSIISYTFKKLLMIHNVGNIPRGTY